MAKGHGGLVTIKWKAASSGVFVAGSRLFYANGHGQMGVIVLSPVKQTIRTLRNRGFLRIQPSGSIQIICSLLMKSVLSLNLSSAASITTKKVPSCRLSKFETRSSGNVLTRPWMVAPSMTLNVIFR